MIAFQRTQHSSSGFDPSPPEEVVVNSSFFVLFLWFLFFAFSAYSSQPTTGHQHESRASEGGERGPLKACCRFIKIVREQRGREGPTIDNDECVCGCGFFSGQS